MPLDPANGQQRRRLVTGDPSPRSQRRSAGIRGRRHQHEARGTAANTPSVINAVFNHRQFWDGRAENVFNGVNHLGQRDPDAKVFRADHPKSPIEVRVELTNSSLAFRQLRLLSATSRWRHLGVRTWMSAASSPKRHGRSPKRIDMVRPLAKQQVHPQDNLLGGLSRWPDCGLNVRTYDELIKRAFHEKWWNSSRLIQVKANGSTTLVDNDDADPDTDEYTLLQYPFALFFGLSVQMYQATLVSDDTPWDRFRWITLRVGSRSESVDNTCPTTSAGSRCLARTCSTTARAARPICAARTATNSELTDASVRRVTGATNGPVRNRDGNVIDKGFNNSASARPLTISASAPAMLRSPLVVETALSGRATRHV